MREQKVSISLHSNVAVPFHHADAPPQKLVENPHMLPIMTMT